MPGRPRGIKSARHRAVAGCWRHVTTTNNNLNIALTNNLNNEMVNQGLVGR